MSKSEFNSCKYKTEPQPFKFQIKEPWECHFQILSYPSPPPPNPPAGPPKKKREDSGPVKYLPELLQQPLRPSYKVALVHVV